MLRIATGFSKCLTSSVTCIKRNYTWTFDVKVSLLQRTIYKICFYTGIWGLTQWGQVRFVSYLSCRRRKVLHNLADNCFRNLRQENKNIKRRKQKYKKIPIKSFEFMRFEFYTGASNNNNIITPNIHFKQLVSILTTSLGMTFPILPIILWCI